MEKAPTKPKINIKGISTLVGTSRIFTKKRIIGRFSINKTMLLMYNDAITAHTRTGCSVMSCGPGRIPFHH